MNERADRAWFAAVLVAVAACSPAPAPDAVEMAAATESILAKASPAPGSTVAQGTGKLELWFDPPARLHEVTVTGPAGIMPIMVTAAGEVGHYSLPMHVVDPGAYTVEWRASAAGNEHSGQFTFTVR